MDYTSETVGDVFKVMIDGRLVAACAEEFKESMFEQLKGHKNILFNLQNMSHIDSSGLGALVSILQWVNSNGGVMKLCCLQSRPKIVFDITKVYRVFDICATEEDALAAFKLPR